MKLKCWIGALRPKTLPLGIAGVLAGNILAAGRGEASGKVAMLSVLVACCLQVVSNLANDIADFASGLDNSRSLGRFHALAEGKLSVREYRAALAVLALAASCGGCSLVFCAFGTFACPGALLMLCLGALALAASLGYSLGKNAYGPKGLGGAAVFFFFGLAGVCGSYYLQAKTCPMDCWVLGAAIGLLGWGVLNINDIRDMENDLRHGKLSLAARLGKKRALVFQAGLYSCSWLGLALFAAMNGGGLRYLVPAALLPFLARNFRKLASLPPELLEPLLGELSVMTLSAAVISACAAA